MRRAERAGKQTVMSKGELIDLWVTFKIKAPHTLFRKQGANHASADQLQGSPYLFWFSFTDIKSANYVLTAYSDVCAHFSP
jgi:hypothetical protein